MPVKHSQRSLQQLLELRACAKGLRRNPTLSEARLWQGLRSQQLGVSFRRQVVLGPYIVDLYASAVRLIVEVDGAHHQTYGPQRRADERRDAELRRRGYSVLRITAERVTAQPEQALELVQQQVLEALALRRK